MGVVLFFFCYWKKIFWDSIWEWRLSSDGSQMWAVDFTNGDIHYSDDYGASFSSSDPSTGYNLLTISVNKEWKQD